MQYLLEHVNEDKLVDIAQSFAARLSGGEVLNLHGDVGAGKTTFTRALAAHLGVTDPVQSPTFTIANHYETPNGLHLAHYDFYRLDDPGIMKQELEETLTDPKAVIVIEWGEIIEDILPGDHLDMYLVPTSESERALRFEADGQKAKTILEAIQ